MTKPILIIFLLFSLCSEKVISNNTIHKYDLNLRSEKNYRSLQDGTLSGTWVREFNESFAGKVYDEKSGRNMKENISGRISLSFSDSQFSLRSTVTHGDSSNSDNMEGEYIISADTIKFYYSEKEIAVLKMGIDDDTLLLTAFESSNRFILDKLSDIKKLATLEGEYKRIRNKKGCGCGH